MTVWDTGLLFLDTGLLLLGMYSSNLATDGNLEIGYNVTLIGVLWCLSPETAPWPLLPAWGRKGAECIGCGEEPRSEYHGTELGPGQEDMGSSLGEPFLIPCPSWKWNRTGWGKEEWKGERPPMGIPLRKRTGFRPGRAEQRLQVAAICWIPADVLVWL